MPGVVSAAEGADRSNVANSHAKMTMASKKKRRDGPSAPRTSTTTFVDDASSPAVPTPDPHSEVTALPCADDDKPPVTVGKLARNKKKHVVEVTPDRIDPNDIAAATHPSSRLSVAEGQPSADIVTSATAGLPPDTIRGPVAIDCVEVPNVSQDKSSAGQLKLCRVLRATGTVEETPCAGLIPNRGMSYIKHHPHRIAKECTNPSPHDANECTFVHFVARQATTMNTAHCVAALAPRPPPLFPFVPQHLLPPPPPPPPPFVQVGKPQSPQFHVKRLDGTTVKVPLSALVPNNATTFLLRNLSGAFAVECSMLTPHDISQCVYAHFVLPVATPPFLPHHGSVWPLPSVSGVAVKRRDGSVVIATAAMLVDNAGSRYLMSHPNRRGKECVTSSSHDVMECTFVHFVDQFSPNDGRETAASRSSNTAPLSDSNVVLCVNPSCVDKECASVHRSIVLQWHDKKNNTLRERSVPSNRVANTKGKLTALANSPSAVAVCFTYAIGAQKTLSKDSLQGASDNEQEQAGVMPCAYGENCTKAHVLFEELDEMVPAGCLLVGNVPWSMDKFIDNVGKAKAIARQRRRGVVCNRREHCPDPSTCTYLHKVADGVAILAERYASASRAANGDGGYW